MTIAIDISRAVNEKAGVGRITYNLIRSLLKIDQENQYILLAVFMRGEKEKQKILNEFSGKNVTVKRLKIPGKVKEIMWNSKLNLVGNIVGKADIFVAPSFLDVIEGLKIPQIVIIHDLTSFIYPEHLGKKLAESFNTKTTKATKKAKHIIAISQATKQDLIDKLKINPNKISVVYPGLADFSKIAKNLPNGLKAKSYVLTVGTVEPRKNLINLFKAYALLPLKLQSQYPLVVVGAKGWNTGKIYETIRQLKLEKKIKMIGFVSDVTLGKLYQDAALFTYPSLYEGFGFPVLEAMSFGTPVITSNISSLPEVVGQAGVLVDPQNPAEMQKAIQTILEHSEMAKKYSELGKIQAKKFDFDLSAKKTLKIIQSLV